MQYGSAIILVQFIAPQYIVDNWYGTLTLSGENNWLLWEIRPVDYIH
jgi:hypothetical protein